MRNSRTKRNHKNTVDIPAFFAKLVRSRKFWIVIGIIVAIIVAAAIVIAVNVEPPSQEPPAQGPQNPDEELVPNEDEVIEGTAVQIEGANRKEGWYTFMVAGTDQGGGNTDTIMVGAYDSVNGKINIVSIPRDTLINVDWAVKKINAAYSRGGVDRLKKELSKIMGFVPDSFAVVNLQAFEELVDAIGGVDYNVPIDMDYEDPTQNLYIHLKAGPQKLNGKDAVGVMRFRSGYRDADIGRINTQQDFLMTLADQVLSVGNVTKIKEIADIFTEHVETNLQWGNIVWYGTEFLKLEEGAIEFFQLPADTLATVRGGSYVSIYLNDWVAMINAKLNPYDTDINAANLNVLTKTKSGLHSTTGTIAGGEDSFLNYYELTGKPDPDAQPEEPVVDPNAGEVIDPNTGLPIDPNTGLPVDPGQTTDPNAGTTDPGQITDPNAGIIDPGTASSPNMDPYVPVDPPAPETPPVPEAPPADPNEGMIIPGQDIPVVDSAA